MNLQEQVAQLQEALPKLASNDQNFAISLIASFRKYKSLTPKQAPWIGKLLAKATTPAFQVVLSSPAPVAPVAQVEVGSFDGVIALFAKAKASGLKFPKITLLVQDKPLTLALAGAKSKTPGAVSIVGEGKYPYRAFYGAVSPEGVWTPAHSTPEFVEALTAVLTKLAKQPARVAKEHGKLTGKCCFCNKKLGEGEDVRSIAVGFGPVCANRYGLKAEWLSGAAKVELVAGNVATEVVVTGAEELAPAVQPVVPVVDKNSMIALGGLPAEAIKCFFCEQPSTEMKVLHGCSVCPACVKSLTEKV